MPRVTSVPTTARPRSTRSTRAISPWWASLPAGLVALSGTGTAALNGDELATISAANRSIGGLLELSQNIDGHFLPYYLFMHFWTVLGSSELWLRLPSALAMAVAAGLIADLGRRLHSSRAGFTAAALFMVLPSVSYFGAFARPYSFAAASVVLAFWALHRAMETRTIGPWALYSATIALVGSTHLFAVLALPAHLIATVPLLPRRTLFTRALPALAVGGLPAGVLAVIGYGEQHAISWIPQRGLDVLLKFPKMAAGGEAVGLLLFAAAIVGALLLFESAGPWAWALLGWLVLPPILLLAVSHLVTPVYVDRYLFVTAPALALLAGIAVARHLYACIGLVVIAGALAIPQQLDIRDDNGRFEDFRWAVNRIDAEPGDALLFGQSRLRGGFDYYGNRSLPDDVLRIGTAPDTTGFGYPERTDVADALQGRERVWVVWRGAKNIGSQFPAYKGAREAGFIPVSSWHSVETPGMTVVLLARP